MHDCSSCGIRGGNIDPTMSAVGGSGFSLESVFTTQIDLLRQTDKKVNLMPSQDPKDYEMILPLLETLTRLLQRCCTDKIS